MNEKEFVKFLDEERLIDYVKKYSPYFKKIFKESLKVNSNEKILIIADTGHPRARVPVLMAGCYWVAAKKLGLKNKLIVQDPKQVSQKAEDPVVESLLDLKEQSVLAVSLSAKLGSLGKIGKSFRKYMKKKGHRFVSTPNLGQMKTELFLDLVKAININYNRLQRIGNNIKNDLEDAYEVRVKTKAGTNVLFDIKGVPVISNTGNYSKPGSGGNIPCGEVYIPPANVNGKVVIDGSMRVMHNTYLIKNPIMLTIEKGTVTKIKGKIEADILEQNMQWAYSMSARNSENIKKIAELGIGINPGASIIGPNIINEKTLGTAHIALGSNAWFGGNLYSKYHWDQVLRNVKLFIDGKELVIKRPRIY